MTPNGNAPGHTLTLRLQHEQGSPVRWLVTFAPPIAGDPETGTLWLGNGAGQVRMAAHLLDNNGEADTTFIVPDVRMLAQLWHTVDSATDATLPARFQAATGSPIAATVHRMELRRTLEQTEQAMGLGPRTQSISPPIYLQSFWGPRQYGQLDAMIARLEHFNIVPEGLLARAREHNAPNGWAVVYPRDLPQKEAVLEALQPLIAHRGGRVFELEHGHAPMVVDEFAASLTQLPPDERPYYLLALGDLDVMSVEYQYFLQSFGAAGRLALATPDAYAAYAEKILRWESATPNPQPPSLVYIATDNDDVNTSNFLDLVEPLTLADDLPRPATVLARGRASKARVLQALRASGERSVVFLSAHGYEHCELAAHAADVVLADQRAFQGALVLDDFLPTRAIGSGDGLLAAGDVSERPVAPGGVVILHACYSAGTVPRETMPEWVHLPMPPRIVPTQPFVSQLSRALLTNPEGPLALYAHVNRSHQAQYYDPAEPGQSLTYRQYHDLLQTLAAGGTVGLGRETARAMTIHYMAQAMTLSHQLEWLITGHCQHGGQGTGWPQKGVAAYERSFLQYSFATCNFRNYLILGDPMTRTAAPQEAATWTT